MATLVQADHPILADTWPKKCSLFMNKMNHYHGHVSKQNDTSKAFEIY